jgi:hypothetical protein
MGRPWEYPRWRRVLMQVVMWLVFAGSLCLAQVLAHNRSVDRTNVVRVGAFELRVPDDFKIDASGPDDDLLAHDPQRNRRLRIQSLPLNGARRSIIARGEDQMPIKFRNLQVTGVLDVTQDKHMSDEGEAVRYRLRARAAVPNVKRVVEITLDVSPGDEQEDQMLMEDLAAGLRIARDAGGTLTDPSSDEGRTASITRPY